MKTAYYSKPSDLVVVLMFQDSSLHNEGKREREKEREGEREREKEREREERKKREKTVVSKEFLRYMKSHRNFS